MNAQKRITHSVGLFICARETNRHLYLLRNDRAGNFWGLPGGKQESSESLLATLKRECQEEMNWWPEHLKVFPIEQYTSNDEKFIYHTFCSIIDSEFMPVLNHEHVGYCWVDESVYPKPLHRGLFNTLNYDIIKEKLAIIKTSIR